MPAAPRVVCLTGPTASGKTGLAVEVVQRLPAGIISVDSAMVYRGMDIGTGKPDAQTLARAPHRLIDIRDPEQTYSAAEFRADALREIAALQAAHRLPLLVGGTGLYFRALRAGLSPLPARDEDVRRRLAAQARARGWRALHERLAAVDPAAAARIHPNDPQRIQRALEVHELTGRPMSELLAGGTDPLVPRAVVVVLEPGARSRLHAAIERRFRDMLARGLVEEVRALRARPGVHRELPAMRAVGYRQVWDYLEDRIDHPTMRARGIAATRQLARRQLTWLRSERAALRLDSQDPRAVSKLLNFLSGLLP